MTTSYELPGDTIIVWPQLDDGDDFAMEHALALHAYSDAVAIIQNGQRVAVPHYAIDAVIKALRKLKGA